MGMCVGEGRVSVCVGGKRIDRTKNIASGLEILAVATFGNKSKKNVADNQHSNTVFLFLGVETKRLCKDDSLFELHRDTLEFSSVSRTAAHTCVDCAMALVC